MRKSNMLHFQIPPLEKNQYAPLTLSPFLLAIDMKMVTGGVYLDTDIEATQFVQPTPYHLTSGLLCEIE